MNTAISRHVFRASAVYDLVLALAFLFFTVPIFAYFGIELPNHMGYLHFPALLLILFGIMYWRIGSDPVRYKVLIPYGIGLKLAYCLVVFYHWAADSVPAIWLPLAWIDLVFLLLFILAWRIINAESQMA